MKIKAIFFLVVIALASPSAVFADQPINDLRVPVGKVLDILKDPQYQGAVNLIAQREKLMAVIKEIFDFRETSKRCVARYWRKFSAKEKDEFTDLFADFLGWTYYLKIRDAYQGEKVEYLSQVMISPRKAVVKTKIPRESVDIPLDYRMLLDNKTWRVYDVVIEGVSLVKNYRSQFTRILRRGNAEKLIRLLKKKVSEQRAKEKARAAKKK